MAGNEIDKTEDQKDVNINIEDIGNSDEVTIKSKLNNSSNTDNSSVENKKTTSVKRNNNTSNKKDSNKEKKDSNKEKIDSENSSDEKSIKNKRNNEDTAEDKKNAEEMFGDQDKKDDPAKSKKGSKKNSDGTNSISGGEGSSKNLTKGLGDTSKQIDASAGKLPRPNGGSKLPTGKASGGGSNPLTQGMKNGLNNLGSAAKEGTKKAAQAAGKAIKSAAKKVASAVAKAIVSNPYVLVAIVVVILILVIGILIYQLFQQDAVNTDIDATVENVNAMQEAINSGELSGEVNQVNEATSLNGSYGSYLGYTSDQLDYLYKKATNTTNLDKDGTRYALIQLYNTKYGSGEENNDGVLRVSDYKELYKHILNTEKYNFNEIEWVNYSHDQDDSRVLTSDDMTIDKSLGIQYPTDSSMTSDKFMELASPYLLSNYIPLSFLVAEVTNSNSPAFSTGLVSNQDTLAELGITSSSGYNKEDSFAYQILKYGLSDITINQYQLKHYLLDTYYLDYDATDYHEEFTVTEVKYYSYTVDSKGNTSATTNYNTTYSYNNDISTIQGNTTHHNTRWNSNNEEDVKLETVVSSYPTYENIYYVTYAKAFDVVKVANYNYTKYNDDDVNNRINADSESIIDSEYNQIDNEENKITSVGTIGSYNDLNQYGTLTTTFVDDQEKNKPSLSNENGVKTYTYKITKKYKVTGKNYVVNNGTRYDIDRQWDDEVTAGDSTTKALTTKYVTEFNKNEENDEDKSTIDEATFQSSDDYSHFDDLSTNKELNVIDILDSNPKVYQNYISAGNSESDYIGLGRKNILTKTAYESILNTYLDTIADENKLNYIYGSSLGYEVSSGSSSSGSGSYGTAYNLMIQLLHEFEGGGTVYQNSEGVDCYKVLNVVGNMTVGYGIDITVNPQWKTQLESQMGCSISFGSLVPCEYVDAIEEDFINRKLSSIEATCSNNGIELKEYQKHALLIRMYNTGNISKFPDSYKSYYNESVDDKYESTYEKYKDQPENVSAIISCADLSSALFNNYLSTPVTSNGQTLSGLVTRRKEEYYLFSLGYYTHNNLHAFYSEGLSFNGIQAVKSDGSIDLDACYQLQAALEDSVFDGKFHSSAPGMTNPWGQKYKPNNRENTDDNGYLSDNFKSFFATSLYYQCPWWSRGRANIYLNSVDSSKFTGQFIRDGLGDGKNLAGGIAKAYGVTLYTDINQLTANCIISYGANSQYGHTAYVEAVGNDYYVISHCGSGVAWHGVSVVPKTVNGLGSGYAFVGFVKMDDIVSKYGK